MYRSIKRQNRISVPGRRRTLSCVPNPTEFERVMAQSDEADLLAIENAMKNNDPLYFICAAEGSTLDVLTSRTAALKRRDLIDVRTYGGAHRTKVYERTHTALIRI